MGRDRDRRDRFRLRRISLQIAECGMQNEVFFLDWKER